MFHGSDTPPTPGRPAVKVKNLGREILKRANTCTWIGFITDDQENNSANPQTKVIKVTNTKVADVKVADQGNVGGGEKPKKEIVGKATVKEPLNVGPCEEIVETQNVQMELLKNLQAQQKTLREQEVVLQEQIHRQMSNNSLAKSCAIPDDFREFENKPRTSELKSDSFTPTSPQELCQEQYVTGQAVDVGASSPQTVSQYPSDVKHRAYGRRRLKGNLAQSCALRDEGSVGSLIFSDRLENDRENRQMFHFWSSDGNNESRSNNITNLPTRMATYQRGSEASTMGAVLKECPSDMSNMSVRTLTPVARSSTGSCNDDTCVPNSHQ